MKGSNLGCRKGHPLVQRQVWQRGGGGGFQCLNQELLFSRYSDADGSDCSSREYRIRENSSGAITLTLSPGESQRRSGPC